MLVYITIPIQSLVTIRLPVEKRRKSAMTRADRTQVRLHMFKWTILDWMIVDRAFQLIYSRGTSSLSYIRCFFLHCSI